MQDAARPAGGDQPRGSSSAQVRHGVGVHQVERHRDDLALEAGHRRAQVALQGVDVGEPPERLGQVGVVLVVAAVHRPRDLAALPGAVLLGGHRLELGEHLGARSPLLGQRAVDGEPVGVREVARHVAGTGCSLARIGVERGLILRPGERCVRAAEGTEVHARRLDGMAVYADPTRCPDCRSTLPPAPGACPACALPLDRARWSRSSSRPCSGPTGCWSAVRATAACAVGAAPTVHCPRRAPVRRGLSAPSVPRILLGLGARLPPRRGRHLPGLRLVVARRRRPDRRARRPHGWLAAVLAERPPPPRAPRGRRVARPSSPSASSVLDTARCRQRRLARRPDVTGAAGRGRSRPGPPFAGLDRTRPPPAWRAAGRPAGRRCRRALGGGPRLGCRHRRARRGGGGRDRGSPGPGRARTPPRARPDGGRRRDCSRLLVAAVDAGRVGACRRPRDGRRARRPAPGLAARRIRRAAGRGDPARAHLAGARGRRPRHGRNPHHGDPARRRRRQPRRGPGVGPGHRAAGLERGAAEAADLAGAPCPRAARGRRAGRRRARPHVGARCRDRRRGPRRRSVVAPLDRPDSTGVRASTPPGHRRCWSSRCWSACSRRRWPGGSGCAAWTRP